MEAAQHMFLNFHKCLTNQIVMTKKLITENTHFDQINIHENSEFVFRENMR